MKSNGGFSSSAATLPPSETSKNAVILRHSEMTILSRAVYLLEEYKKSV